MDITTWCFSPLEMLGQAFTAPALSYCLVLSSCTKAHPLLVCDQVTDIATEEYHISLPQKSAQLAVQHLAQSVLASAFLIV